MWNMKSLGRKERDAASALAVSQAIDRNTVAVAEAHARKPIAGILTGIAAVAAVCSAIFTGAQASSLALQIEQANSMLNAQTLGAVSVSGEGTVLSITNRSGIPFESVGVWVIAEDNDNHLLEVLGEATGLASCSNLEIDLSEQLGTAVIAETMTAIQLPSGQWHLIAAGGRTELIDYPGSSAAAALKNSEFYVVSADTYWEGADGWDEIELERQIIANAPRTGLSPAPAELSMSECAT